MVFEVKPLRCVIVDDNRHFLGAAANLLERQGIKVVGTYSTSADALRCIEELRPDLVVLDVDLGQENGFELAERIHRDIDDGPMLVMVSAHDQEDFVDIIATSPAVGFLLKSSLSARALTDLMGRR